MNTVPVKDSFEEQTYNDVKNKRLTIQEARIVIQQYKDLKSLSALQLINRMNVNASQTQE